MSCAICNGFPEFQRRVSVYAKLRNFPLRCSSINYVIRIFRSLVSPHSLFFFVARSLAFRYRLRDQEGKADVRIPEYIIGLFTFDVKIEHAKSCAESE